MCVCVCVGNASQMATRVSRTPDTQGEKLSTGGQLSNMSDKPQQPQPSSFCTSLVFQLVLLPPPFLLLFCFVFFLHSSAPAEKTTTTTKPKRTPSVGGESEKKKKKNLTLVLRKTITMRQLFPIFNVTSNLHLYVISLFFLSFSFPTATTDTHRGKKKRKKNARTIVSSSHVLCVAAGWIGSVRPLDI